VAERCWIASDSIAAVGVAIAAADSRRLAGAGLKLGFVVDLATTVTVAFGLARVELVQSGWESEFRCPLRRSEEE
jgi:hypothetical protein